MNKKRNSASVTRVIAKIGMEKFEELANVADTAIWEDGLRMENRLSFASNLEHVYPQCSIDELVEVFIFRLWANHK